MEECCVQVADIVSSSCDFGQLIRPFLSQLSILFAKTVGIRFMHSTEKSVGEMQISRTDDAEVQETTDRMK